MKYIDKFLKKIHTDRNTFATFILALVTLYIMIDRVVEMLLMIFTGVSSAYWGPITYTFALACPVFAYMFSASSSFSDTRAAKTTLFYLFLISLYVIVVSMITQFLNKLLWVAFISTPNYFDIVAEFPEHIRPAFSGVAIYFPLVTIMPFINLILLDIDDTMVTQKSIWDYKGISLKPKKDGTYSCDLKLFKDFFDASKVDLPQESRFRSTLVCGASGSGKTSMVFEPSIAQDIEKKYFFREAAKELGFSALKTGIANLSAPYSNDYLNKNFSLNMLIPAFGKEKLFSGFLKNITLSSSPDVVYKDIGITYMSPDYETLSNMMKVCDNYDVKYNLVDPSQPDKSIGINPFVYDDPAQIAIVISTVIQGTTIRGSHYEKDEYREETFLQTLENLAILLKEIYPKMNSGALPNLEDMLAVLSNFELVEKMCGILERDEELSQKYQILLSFFKRTFYKDGSSREEMQTNANYLATRIENILRSSNIRAIICNRYENINFDDALKNGEVIFVCTRRGESGRVVHQSFGLFFLLSMQRAILARPGNETSRIPHFLYIDEFPDFQTRDTETMFTMYRKYRVATTISIQSIAQLGKASGGSKYNSIILANCANKIYTGGSTPPEELKWWADEFGTWRQWKFSRNYDASKGVLEGGMESKFGNPEFKAENKVKDGRLQMLGQDGCGYKLMKDGGKYIFGQGIMHYLPSKYKEKHPSKVYDFEKYANLSTSPSSTSSTSKFGSFRKKMAVDATSGAEIDPVQYSNSRSEFDNEGIIIDLKNNKASK